MKKQFSTCMIGYNREEVDNYLDEIISDYEEELRKKKDRIFELVEENRDLKMKIKELRQTIERFNDQEKYISRALIEAEQRAQTIVEEGQRKTQAEFEKLKLEKDKWRKKFRDVRQDLLEFEKTLVNIIERFRDEINYYAAKEISDAILVGRESEEDSGLDSSDKKEPLSKDETEKAPIEEVLKVERNKEKVIA